MIPLPKKKQHFFSDANIISLDFYTQKVEIESEKKVEDHSRTFYDTYLNTCY